MTAEDAASGAALAPLAAGAVVGVGPLRADPAPEFRDDGAAAAVVGGAPDPFRRATAS